MAGFKDQIDPENLPVHVAIIMDGNGRWARKKGGLRIFGHQNAIKAVRDSIEGAAEIGIKHLTLFVFSTENWQRPDHEVAALMELLVQTLKKETPTLMKNNIRLCSIGNTEDLPAECKKNLYESIQETAGNTDMTLTLALSYGSRKDIADAARKIAEEVKSGKLDPGAITEDLFQSKLSTHWMPEPELLIRTSGEYRISNFLLWEIAYAEIYITEKLWPDFSREDLYEAIVNFQSRERRFGKTSEQLRTL